MIEDLLQMFRMNYILDKAYWIFSPFFFGKSIRMKKRQNCLKKKFSDSRTESLLCR